jgi:hypothetical protein
LGSAKRYRDPPRRRLAPHCRPIAAPEAVAAKRSLPLHHSPPLPRAQRLQVKMSEPAESGAERRADCSRQQMKGTNPAVRPWRFS